MSLTSTQLLFSAAGRVQVASGGTVANFNGGTPIDADGGLCVSSLGPPPPPPPPPPPIDTFVPLWSQPTGGLLVNGGKGANQNVGGTSMEANSVNALPSTGKWYFEIQVTKVTSPSPDAGGIAKDKPFTGANLGAMARGTGALTYVAAGVTSATQVTWGGAGTLMFAYDAAAGKLWVGKDGTWFASGNPATNTNPYYSTIPAATYYAAYHSNGNGATNTATLASGPDTTVYPPPSGFYYLAAGDPYWANVVLLLDGQLPTASGAVAVDRSSYAHTAASATMQASTTQAKYGGQSVQNNSTWSTRYTSAPEFIFGTGDYTLEAWVYLLGVSVGQGLMGKRDLDGNVANSWSLLAELDGAGHAGLQKHTGSGVVNHPLTSTMPTGTWVHIAFSKLSGTLRGFFQGAKEVEVADTFDYGNNAQQVVVGTNSSAGSGYFNGFIYARLTKGVARYGSSNFTPPAWFPAYSNALTYGFGATSSHLRTVNRGGLYGETLSNVVETEGIGLSSRLLPTTGKLYWEYILNEPGLDADSTAVGIAKSTNVTGTNRVAMAMGTGALTYVHASVVSAAQVGWAAVTGGARMMIAYDADAGKMWVGKNGTWFSSGDPAAGTNPYYSSLPANDGTWHAALLMPYNVVGGNVWGQMFTTLPQMAFTPPTGFSAVFGGTATTLWTMDFNQALASLQPYTIDDSFSVFQNANGGLRMRTGVDNDSQVVSWDNSPIVQDFDLTLTCKLSSDVGPHYSGRVHFRSPSPGNGTMGNFPNRIYLDGPNGTIVLEAISGSSSNHSGPTGGTYAAFGNNSLVTFRLRSQGLSTMAWLNGVLGVNTCRSSAGAPSRIYFGQRNFSGTTAGYFTIVAATINSAVPPS